jgi:uncharacterized protein (DUF3084 family)
MDLIERIEHQLESAMGAVKTAAERCDVRALQQLSRLSQRLKDLKDRAIAVDQELRALENETSSALPSDGELNGEIASQPGHQTNATGAEGPTVSIGSNARRMVIEVTQGMINQNLLTLTEHVKAGRIRTGLEMKIEARPSGELFCTDLLSEGNRLRERGAIARFYRDARVHAGDRVVLFEQAPNRWTLEKFQQTLTPLYRSDQDGEIKI